MPWAKKNISRYCPFNWWITRAWRWQRYGRRPGRRSVRGRPATPWAGRTGPRRCRGPGNRSGSCPTWTGHLVERKMAQLFLCIQIENIAEKQCWRSGSGCFGPPGSGTGSISQRYGSSSGSFSYLIKVLSRLNTVLLENKIWTQNLCKN